MTARWELFLEDLRKLEVVKPHVFISYAWDGEHTAVLHERLTRLRSDLCLMGCEVTYDIFSFTTDLREDMRKAVNNSHAALMICTKAYKLKVAEGAETNVRFEYELIMAKHRATAGTKEEYKIFPLLFSGNRDDAVPEQLSRILVRDCTCHSSYHLQLFGLSNPLGIVPAMMQLQSNLNYRQIWNEYSQSSKESAWSSLLRRIREMPIKKPNIYISYALPESGLTSELSRFLHKLHTDLSRVGHTTELDMCDNHGDRKVFMQRGIASADVILLVCTPLLVTRIAEQGSFISEEYSTILDRRDGVGSMLQVYPILYDGDVDDAVPREFREYYIRRAGDYESFLTSRVPPVGLIPSLLGIDESDSIYRGLLRSFKFMNVDNLKNMCGGYYSRRHELDQMRANFRSTKVQTIYGIGGSGKTQLALQYAHYYRYDYSICRFIDATKLIASVTSFAVAMGLEISEDETSRPSCPGDVKSCVPAWIPAVMRCLYEQLDNHSWLIIFNNVPKEADIDIFLPSGSNALLNQHVLLTTRCPSLIRKGIQIKGFRESDGLAYLKILFPSNGDKELSQLSALLGHSPYALKLVWLYVTKCGISLSTYMEFLREEPLHALNETISDDEYSHKYPGAIGLHCIKSDEARRILKICLCSSGQDVPLTLITESMNIPKSKLFELLKELNSASLIHEERGCIVLHPLVSLLSSVSNLGDIGHNGDPLFSPNPAYRYSHVDCLPTGFSSASTLASAFKIGEAFPVLDSATPSLPSPAPIRTSDY
jgi:hypothetical protein